MILHDSTDNNIELDIKSDQINQHRLLPIILVHILIFISTYVIVSISTSTSIFNPFCYTVNTIIKYHFIIFDKSLPLNQFVIHIRRINRIDLTQHLSYSQRLFCVHKRNSYDELLKWFCTILKPMWGIGNERMK